MAHTKKIGLVCAALAGCGFLQSAASSQPVALAPPSSAQVGTVGDIKTSMLLEPQLQALPEGAGWVLADGRDVSGSRFATITGMTRVPDLRGVYLRGKNYSRSAGTGNADGDLPLGAYQANQNLAHTHGYTYMKYDNAVDGVDSCCKYSGEHHNDNGQTANSGGNEARPNSVTVNYFIKIN